MCSFVSFLIVCVSVRQKGKKNSAFKRKLLIIACMDIFASVRKDSNAYRRVIFALDFVHLESNWQGCPHKNDSTYSWWDERMRFMY